MKNILTKIAYSFIALSAILLSCKKDTLNIDNPNTLTATQFWKTEADAQSGLNAAYTMFYKPGIWSRWIYFRLDLTSDEGWSQSPWIELGDWTRFQYVNYDFWEGNVNTFRDTYKAIFRCNQVLDNIENIPFADNNKKEQIKAQAKFLRALHYYYAALLWENVPLVLVTSKPDDMPQQNTLQEVWAQVEKDLTEAAPALPAKWDDASVGRPTKGAVMGFLARTYMQQHKWTEAKTALDYFFTGEGRGMYGLVSNFKDNFTHYNENNTESVFEIQFSDANIGGGDGDDPNQGMGNNREQFFAPRGIGWSDGQARHWMVDEFKKERTIDGKLDPRLQSTLFYKEITQDFGDKIYGRDWQWGDDEAWFRKYQRDYYRNTEDYYAQVNNRLIRYADILLLYAEVLNEQGQTASAYQYVDQVRARATLNKLEVVHPEIGNDKAKFKERLKMERELELCGESVRWADLKRWGDLDSQAAVDKVAQRDPDFKNFVVGKHIRLPLPQQEVNNNTNLKQNPGY